MVEKKHNLRKQLDTIVYPQTNHIIVYQGCSWTSFWKIVLMFSFNKISYIYIFIFISNYILFIIIYYYYIYLGNWTFLSKALSAKLDVLVLSLHVCTAASRAQQRLFLSAHFNLKFLRLWMKSSFCFCIQVFFIDSSFSYET